MWCRGTELHGRRAELHTAALLSELPRRKDDGAGGGTCTPGVSRSAAACLRCSATPAFRIHVRAQGPGLEPGIFAFRARRGTDSTIPVHDRGTWEWRSGAATPARVSTRAPNSACVMRARIRIHSNVGIQGVKGQGPSPPSRRSVAIPVTGQQKRTWRPARPFEVREADVPYCYGANSPLSRCAWHAPVRLNSCGSACVSTVFSHVHVPDCSGSTAASELTRREYIVFWTIAGDVARCNIRSPLRDASAWLQHGTAPAAPQSIERWMATSRSGPTVKWSYPLHRSCDMETTIGGRTRAARALFAMEHGLLR